MCGSIVGTIVFSSACSKPSSGILSFFAAALKYALICEYR